MARTTANKKTTEDGAIPVNADRRQMIDELMKQVNKEIPSETGTLMTCLGDSPNEVETISSGSNVLNAILGGGLARGRLIEIFGPEASGKTSVALTAVGNAQKNGGFAAFIDLENALDPKYARKLGVDTKSLYVIQPDYAEQTFDIINKLTASGLFDIIVVDSIASMVPRQELEAGMDQQTIGLLARVMSRGLKQLISIASRTNTTVLFINQIRDDIGKFSPYGAPMTTPGGKAMKFYASQRIDVRRLKPVVEGSETIGNEVKMKVVKNKIAPPFGEGTTVLTYNKGINQAAEMVETGADYGVLIKHGNRTYKSIEDPEFVYGTSKAKAIKYFEDHPDELEKLSTLLSEKISQGLQGNDDEDKSTEDDENLIDEEENNEEEEFLDDEE